MLLAIDVGNTAVSIGVFDNGGVRSTWRLSPQVGRTADEYGVLILTLLERGGLDSSAVDSAVIGSVIHGMDTTFEEACQRYLKVRALVVGTGVRTGLRILYDSPREVGVDRVADAVAAIKLYGAPLIVVDLGTATVFDAISEEGDYLGGAISPGLVLGAEVLFERAAKLYRVEMDRPSAVIGRTTVAAMQSGIVHGHVCLVEGMVERFKKELGLKAKVIATGGYGELIASQTKVIDSVNEDLTLIGLQMIYELNRS